MDTCPKNSFWKAVLGKAAVSPFRSIAPERLVSYDILKDNEIKRFNIPGKKENLKSS